jgi:hypothetical protein
MNSYLDVQRQHFLKNLWRWKFGMVENGEQTNNYVKPRIGSNFEANSYNPPNPNDDSPNASLHRSSTFVNNWSSNFERYMRLIPFMVNEDVLLYQKRRLLFGMARYGKFGDKEKALKQDRRTYISDKFINYLKTSNKENLVDIANVCLLQFEENPYPNCSIRKLEIHKNNQMEYEKDCEGIHFSENILNGFKDKYTMMIEDCWDKIYLKQGNLMGLVYIANYVHYIFSMDKKGIFEAGQDENHIVVT